MQNKIQNITGELLYQGIASGIKNLLEYKDTLDEINVFPVPDGDTGTNMCFTLLPIIEEGHKQVSEDAYKTLTMIADLALDSARGNSGTLIAQWFHGMRRSAEDKSNLEIKDFVEAFNHGYKSASESLLNPKEGTIITVMRAVAEKASELEIEGCNNYQIFLKDCYEASEIALQNTKNTLQILKKTNVVDAGALGFVLIFQGVLHMTQKGSQIQTTHLDISYEHDKIESLKKDIDFTIHNKFCTECIIKSDDINRKKLKESVKDFGDSMVLAGSKQRVKMHIHTNEPAKFFSACEQFGNVSDRKADDMTKQEHTRHHDDGTDVAIVADSGADIPEDYLKDVHIVSLRYSFGSQQHLDKLTQTTKEFYDQMQIDTNHPKTSQAIPRDFKKMYDFVTSHHNSIISINISSKVSGTYGSALNASKAIKNKNIYVLDSCTVSVAQGLLAMYAIDLKSQGKSFNDIIRRLEESKKLTQVYAVFKDMKYVVKGGRISKTVKKITDFLNVRPILTTNLSGKLKPGGILYGKRKMALKMSYFINKKIKNYKCYRVVIAHANCLEKGEELLDHIARNNSNILSSYIVNLGGALGVHAGPGSLVVGLQELNKDEI